ncbi:MAG: hypothetical protein GF370_03090 [Candidatus Nealsonbacteria bacterium]|nr:hypothetical protein [Candidatus Nealsonbacteria bacterium]
MISIGILFPVLTQIIVLFLGFLVFFNKPNSKLNKVFLLFSLSVVLWVISVFFADFFETYEMALFWTRISVVGPVLSGPLLFYFSEIFKEKEGRINNLQKFLILASIIFFMILSPTPFNVEKIEIKEWGTDFTPGPLYGALLIHVVFFFGLAFRNFFQAYKETGEKIKKDQITYLSAGFVSGVMIAILTNIILPTLNLAELSKYGPSIASVFFISFSSIAILKHRLLNIKIILTELLVYILVATLLIRTLLSSDTNELIFNIVVLITTTIIGSYLIKSINMEIKRREEKEEMARKLRQAYTQLRKLDRAKTEFMSIASHQLRTPLTAIKGYLSLIKEEVYGEVPDDMKKPLDNVYVSSERLIKLVNDLLNISRIESGKVKAEIEKISLEDIIDSIVEELRSIAQEKELLISWKKPEEALPKVPVDKDKIRQVILNLIDNAIRYTEEGEVSVKCGVKDDKFKMSVEDTGPGMTKEELSSIFESFRRGSAGKTTWTGGSGLGLYIAKKYVDLHGGRIWAESPGKGKGSTFHLELPINN